MTQRRFWKCECCDGLLVTLPQDSAADYQCPQCAKVKCEHGGLYREIDRSEFVRDALGIGEEPPTDRLDKQEE